MLRRRLDLARGLPQRELSVLPSRGQGPPSRAEPRLAKKAIMEYRADASKPGLAASISQLPTKGTRCWWKRQTRKLTTEVCSPPCGGQCELHGPFRLTLAGRDSIESPCLPKSEKGPWLWPVPSSFGHPQPKCWLALAISNRRPLPTSNSRNHLLLPSKHLLLCLLLATYLGLLA